MKFLIYDTIPWSYFIIMGFLIIFWIVLYLFDTRPKTDSQGKISVRPNFFKWVLFPRYRGNFFNWIWVPIFAFNIIRLIITLIVKN